MTKRKKGKKMATQMAATPIVYGEQAQEIIQKAKKQTSKKAKANGEKLVKFFSRFEK